MSNRNIELIQASARPARGARSRWRSGFRLGSCVVLVRVLGRVLLRLPILGKRPVGEVCVPFAGRPIENGNGNIDPIDRQALLRQSLFELR